MKHPHPEMCAADGKTIPNTLGELMLLAVTDLEALMQFPNFRLRLGDWVQLEERQGGNCDACLAGAVLLRRGSWRNARYAGNALTRSGFNRVTFADSSRTQQEWMSALDDTRHGQLEWALYDYAAMHGSRRVWHALPKTKRQALIKRCEAIARVAPADPGGAPHAGEDAVLRTWLRRYTALARTLVKLGV